MIQHILERAIIHIFSALTVYVGLSIVLEWCFRKHRDWTIKLMPALLGIGFIGWREAYDVANGQPLLKAYTDYVSWAIGMACAIWLIRRFIKIKA